MDCLEVFIISLINELWVHIETIDIAITRFLNIYCATPLGDFIMVAATTLGRGHILFVVCVVIIYFFCPKENFWRRVVEVVVVIVVTGVIVQALKELIPRARPIARIDDVRIIAEKWMWASFPSGHAANAFAVATYLAKMFKKHQIAFFLVATLIAISRVYVAVHYPTDIIVGALLGVICGMLLYDNLKLYNKNPSK